MSSDFPTLAEVGERNVRERKARREPLTPESIQEIITRQDEDLEE